MISTKFKPGDKICHTSAHGTMTGVVCEQSIAELEELRIFGGCNNFNRVWAFWEDSTDNVGYMHENHCRLHEAAKPEVDELQALIDKANEGIKALCTLNRDHVDAIVTMDGDTVIYGGWDGERNIMRAINDEVANGYRDIYKLAKKPVEKPNPVRLNVGLYGCKITKTTTEIGCQIFNTSILLGACIALLNNGYKYTLRPLSGPTLSIRACLGGVYASSGLTIITWDEVKTLKNILEQVLK